MLPFWRTSPLRTPACSVLVMLACVMPAVHGGDPVADPAVQTQLRERIRDMAGGMKDVPLPAIIEALTGRRILHWQGESRDTLLSVADQIERRIAESEIEASRVNEAGNRVETVVIEAMRAAGIDTHRPRAESGRMRSAGYPDLEAEIDGAAFYIEVKTFSAATIDSSQRSFYLSPSTDFKVTRDAFHLLVAIELVPTSRGSYRARSVRWLDLSGLHCDLKYEFNASNRDLYRRESGLVIVELPVAPDPSAPAMSPPSEPPPGLSSQP